MSTVNAQFQDWKGNIYHFETSTDMIRGLNENFSTSDHVHDDRYYTEDEIDEMADNLKKCVVDGKNKIANAINDKTNNNQMNKENTFDELADGIRNIQTGCPINGIIKEYKVKKGETIIAGDFVNFVNGGSGIFNKPPIEIIDNSNVNVKALQYNENVILIAWHVTKNNVDYIYVCDLKIERENVVKGNDVLICSIKRVDDVPIYRRTRIEEFNGFDKIGNSNRVFLLYTVSEEGPWKQHFVEIQYNSRIFFTDKVASKPYLEHCGEFITHVKNYTDEENLFFCLAKNEEGIIRVVVLKFLKNNDLWVIGNARIPYVAEKEPNKWQFIDVKPYSNRSVITLWRKIGTNDYHYERVHIYDISESSDGTTTSFGYQFHGTTLHLIGSQYIYLGIFAMGAESIIIYGDTKLYAKILHHTILSKPIEVIDCACEISHSRICNVFDTNTYIDTIGQNQYRNSNVGNIIICFNDNNGKYFAELGIHPSVENYLIEEQKVSKCITGNLYTQISKFNYPIHIAEESYRVFFICNNNLIVIKLSRAYKKSIEIESIVNLSKMNLNFNDGKKEPKIFFINNRYIVINPYQNVESFLLDSDLNTGIINSSSELEAYNATNDEIFAGVAKTSGTGGQYIEAYVSRCRQ